jgi:hypothetical protein
MESLFVDWSDERLQREWDRDDKSDLAWTVALADELHRRGFSSVVSGRQAGELHRRRLA